MNYSYITSESVSEGHPDKIADQISDAILDDIISKDKFAKVACETYIKSNIVIVGGEINTKFSIDIDNIVRKTIKNIGYIDSIMGLNAYTCKIINLIGDQSTDILLGIEKKKNDFQGAGDQGIVFGYATNETKSYMPIPILYAHNLVKKQSVLRKNKFSDILYPDAKSQITFIYDKNKIIGIDNIIFSTQHSKNISYNLLKELVMEEIIYSIIPKKWLKKKTKYFINTTGRFVIGGPLADCGITGRKIIVDTYGGSAKHGGGAFSGKDPSKVDRSGAYIARYVAKNIVASKLADKCEIQISYAIGISKPVSININTFNTEKIPLNNFIKLINLYFDLKPFNIIKKFNLLRPIYLNTSVYGHFGRSEFPWEDLDQVNNLIDFKNNLSITYI